jgi:N-acetylglucosamine-6-sulfatase
MRTLARPHWLMIGIIVTVMAGLIVAAIRVPAIAHDADHRPANPAALQGAPLALPAPSQSTPTRPNIVFVLTDDLSWNLVKYMPQVKKLQQDGVTFSNYTVTDSLCCPSRSSIFTGKFPHDTGVFTNNAPDGGFEVFHGRGNEKHTYATAMQAGGYTTGLMGKYLNGYLPKDRYVPPGWNEWDVSGKAYSEYNYTLNENGKPVYYGSKPTDYLNDVMSAKGADFINRNAAAKKPFVLEVASYAPHSPYAPAVADVNKFPGLKAPHGKAFDRLPANPPAWLAGHGPLSAAEKADLDIAFRKRVQAVQSVDRMIGHLRATLESAGVADNTYFVFSSDNGYHLGEYRLGAGKQTAFDTDVHVPLVVAGPDIKAGTTRSEVTQNIDLAPTFEDLADVPIPPTVDGHSLVPLLHGEKTPSWRNVALIEHHGPDAVKGDPDAQTPFQGIPPTYDALRTNMWTYVEYRDGALEYYDRSTDPNELINLASTLSATRKAELHKALVKLRHCHSYQACWAAGHLSDSAQL